MLAAEKKYFVVASIFITPTVEGVTREVATEAAFDQLVDLVMDNEFDGISDPDVTADLAEGRLDLCMGVEGPSQLEATRRVQSAMEGLSRLGFAVDVDDYALSSRPLVAG